MSTMYDLNADLEQLSEMQGRQDAALGEAWPDNPSPAYRRGRESYYAEDWTS